MTPSVPAGGCCVGLYELPVVSFLLGPSFHPGGLETTSRLAQAALVAPGVRVLDVAAGRGTTAFHLAERFGAVVTGLDASDRHVEAANATARARGLDDRVHFVPGRAGRLPFGAACFDVVVCECALCTFDDPDVALAEMARVLVPGGRAAISDVVLRAPLPPDLQDALARALCIANALDEAGYASALTRAGFTAIATTPHDEAVLATIDRIERRLGALEALGAVPGDATLLSTPRARATLASARAFVRSGGAGYASFVGRRPRR